ncbi:unnamed protein product [Calypogeia fissa]
MAISMSCKRMRMRVGNDVPKISLSSYNNKNNDDLDQLLRQKMPQKVAKSNSGADPKRPQSPFLSENSKRVLERVRDLMRDAIYMKKTEVPDLTLSKLREEYVNLDWENRQRALVVLSSQFGVDRERVRDLINHYTSLNLETEEDSDGTEAALYRTEHDLRSALTPLSGRLFEQMNGQAGGLKFLVDLRADLLNTIKVQNLASLRALDTELKGLFATWLGPACVELRQITWDNSAALLEKIVAYEAVHPVSNLYDLKRRLGVGRRCYSYFHPAIPGEPLVFIEVALSNDVVGSIQSVLFEEPPIAEADATTAMFYSISSTQTGLAGIDLGNFLIKGVVRLLQHDMPNIQTFVTLSPIPGFMNWLLPKLELQIKLCASNTAENSNETDEVNPSSAFKEEVLFAEEGSALLNVTREDKDTTAIEMLRDLLKSPDQEWAKSKELTEVLRPILMRLCARYILQEKKRGRALDPVTNFHLRNGASVERLNWMGDTSPNGLKTYAGMMVNYMYRLEQIESNNQAYLNKGVIAASSAMEGHLKSRL